MRKHNRVTFKDIHEESCNGFYNGCVFRDCSRLKFGEYSSVDECTFIDCKALIFDGEVKDVRFVNCSIVDF